jgi:ribosomal protein S12 methylthiotransferase accessory factor
VWGTKLDSRSDRLKMPKEITDLIDKLVSPFSVACEIQEIPLQLWHLPIQAFVSVPALVDQRTTNPQISWTAGVGFTRYDAISGALGEAVERYSWCSVDYSRAILAKESEIVEDFCPMDEACLLFRGDLRKDEVLRRFRNATVPWLRAKRLRDHADALVPAVDLFHAMLPEKLRASIISTTNGIAAHTTFEQACLHATCELVERDAAMQMWYLRNPPVRTFPLTYLDEGVGPLLAKASALGLEITVLDTTTDIGIPCAVAYVARREAGSECAAFGSAASLDSHRAARKAVVEACAMWNSLEGLKNALPVLSWREKSLGFPHINSFEDHVLLYTYPWAKEGYAFLMESRRDRNREKPVKPSRILPIREELDILVKVLSNKGYECYAVDITPDDIHSLGLYVVKAIVPGLVPLAVGKYTHIDCAKLPVGAIANEWPHPFP